MGGVKLEILTLTVDPIIDIPYLYWLYLESYGHIVVIRLHTQIKIDSSVIILMLKKNSWVGVESFSIQ